MKAATLRRTLGVAGWALVLGLGMAPQVSRADSRDDTCSRLIDDMNRSYDEAWFAETEFLEGYWLRIYNNYSDGFQQLCAT